MLKKMFAIAALTVCGLINLEAEAVNSSSKQVEGQVSSSKEKVTCAKKKRNAFVRKVKACKKVGRQVHHDNFHGCRRCGHEHRSMA